MNNQDNLSINQPVNNTSQPEQVVQTTGQVKPATSKKKMILGIASLVLLSVIALAGYLFINNETKEKLGYLEEEIRTFTPPPVTSPKPLQALLPSPSPRNLIMLSQPAEPTSKLYLQTSQKSYPINQPFELTVYVETNNEVVDGVEFILSYNPSLVEIGEPVLGSFFSLYPQKKVNVQKGEVRIIALQGFNENKQLKKAVVITLPVKPLKKGSAEFTFIKNKAHIAAYGGQELLEKAWSLTVTIN